MHDDNRGLMLGIQHTLQITQTYTYRYKVECQEYYLGSGLGVIDISNNVWRNASKFWPL